MSQLTSNLSYINSIKSDIKSAIEAKGVDMTGYSFPDYPAAISQISTGGELGYISISQNGFYEAAQYGVDGFAYLDVSVPQSVTGYTEKDITEATYKNMTSLSNDASFVGSSAFRDWKSLLTVYLPSCSILYQNAFQGCSSLTQVNLPVCTQIDSYALYGCLSLSEVFLPMCKSIGDCGMQYCSSLSTIDLPECTYIGAKCFQQCSSLISVNLPKCISLLNSAFSSCWSLTSIDLPMCFNLGSYAFYGCSQLQTASVGYVLDLVSGVFYNCSMLQSITGLYVTRNVSDPFTNCSNLRTVQLPIFSAGTSQLRLDYASLLTSVSIGNELYFVPSYPSFHQDFIQNVNSASIYVDAAMYDQWVVADGWSSLSSMFYSYGDATAPMLSVDSGVLYGKTAAIFNNWSSYVSTTEITSVNLPNCRFVNYGAIYGSQITSISLPACKYLNASAINCNHLTSIDLPVCELITPDNTAPFNRCEALRTITIGTSKVCVLTSTRLVTWWDSISIYVPASLVDAYKSADNWSVHASQIFPIE